MLEKQLADALVISAERNLQEAPPDGMQPRLEPRRPENVTEELWKGLSYGQKQMRRVRKLANRIMRRDLELSDGDMLGILYEKEGITPEAIAAIEQMWAGSKLNDRNPTRDRLAPYVIGQLRMDQPIRFSLSQCLAKDPSVREGKMAWCLQGEQKSTRKFLEGVEMKGWKELKKIMDGLPVASQATVYLGDMDFRSLDCCEQWCTPEDMACLTDQAAALRESLQTKADVFFGANRVTVRLWSEEYNTAAYREETGYAGADKAWRTEEFMQTSRYPYLERWGYRTIAKKLGLQPGEIGTFIDNDIIRTAAQYRVESRIMQTRGNIICWAETVASALWPIQISEYDGKGGPPQLILTY